LDFSNGLENERTGRLRWINMQLQRMLVGTKSAGRVDIAPDGRSMLTTTVPADRRAHPKPCGLLAPPSRSRLTDDGSARETDEFAERLIGVVNSGTLALMISVGLRTGLFETMEALAPSTSAEIAAAAGLEERYVREWLAAVSTGGVVVHDPANLTFFLSPKRAAALKRVVGGPGGNQLGALAQHVGLLAGLEDGVVDCFRHGGGLPYEAMWSAMSAQGGALDEPGPLEDVALVEGALPVVPQVVERLRLGIDVADVGCGAGLQLNVMAYGGMGLGTVWGEQLARQMITEAGFTSVETVHLPGDLINCYHVASMA
jgi:hypothetical protein